ncbi:Citrate transporter [Magnetococcus marinus MC-1]|uniref:Citrate transporter n=1 Tax=Magnetococcus marinus (strain ATCC BAA-1437 / JCM 17883 / MC-1) TaxID=156889 RepID=A0L8E3_MAGMM|nr:SLC13 family permease [Magnetococcus marinus]ABK44236.1 Citrate transporter [Magnetococcus marinus MC-1]
MSFLNIPVKQIVAATIFAIIALYFSTIVPTIQIAWVMGILILTIYLFSFEVVGVDVAAITVMVLLGVSSLLAPYMGLEAGLVNNQHLFNGFSSNAVISIIAVMIIGAGLDKTGVMGKMAGFILKIGGTTEGRIIPIISGTVSFISSFMQNVGAAALFIPVVSRISARSGIPMSRLLMPMGFCAILGGTVTMVGSSPLILLNDLILNSNAALPAEKQMATWGLFSVTPIGLALVSTGILYFVLAGRFVLPASGGKGGNATSPMTYFRETYGLDYVMNEVLVPSETSLVGKNLFDIEHGEYKIRVIAVQQGPGDIVMGHNGLSREFTVRGGMVLGVMGIQSEVNRWANDWGLLVRQELKSFHEALSATKAGIAEVVIPPSSDLVNKSARDVWMRKTMGLSMIGLHRGGKTLQEGDGIRAMPLQAGDTLVVHTSWETLARIEKDRNFVVVTTEYPREELRPNKVGWAALFFVIALSMVLFSDLRLSVALLTGAVGMILSGVLTIDEAYQAVSWKTVFLLASLIPLGAAVETSGTAAWIAREVLAAIGTPPTWVLQGVIAVLATFFTLVMSNVGATVLLVPLAINIALEVGANPAVFALTVAIATSNSFLIPTHQVNALIMGPAGYRVPDFMRAGGIMTLLFLIVMMVMMNLIF